MTVKVIGVDQKYLKKVSCKHCASILEYTRSDIKEIKYPDWGGTVDDEYIECPRCESRVFLQ